jgi:hypothetical protein
MKKLLKNNLFGIFAFIATVAASQYTWFGVYEAKKPEALKR